MPTISVNLPADCWLFKLPPEHRNAAANRAIKSTLAADWQNSRRMQPFEVAGRVMVIPVPVAKPLAEKFAALAGARRVCVNTIVGCLAETWLNGANLDDAVEQVEGMKDALRYQGSIEDAIAGERV